jgi:hypothetical protein
MAATAHSATVTTLVLKLRAGASMASPTHASV